MTDLKDNLNILIDKKSDFLKDVCSAELREKTLEETVNEILKAVYEDMKKKRRYKPYINLGESRNVSISDCIEIEKWAKEQGIKTDE